MSNFEIIFFNLRFIDIMNKFSFLQKFGVNIFIVNLLKIICREADRMVQERVIEQLTKTVQVLLERRSIIY